MSTLFSLNRSDVANRIGRMPRKTHVHGVGWRGVRHSPQPDDSGPAANHLGRPGRLWFLEFMGRGRRPLLRLEPRSRRRSSRQHPPRAGRPQHAGGACHRVRPTHDTGLPHRGPARPAAQSHQPLDTTAGRSCRRGDGGHLDQHDRNRRQPAGASGRTCRRPRHGQAVQHDARRAGTTIGGQTWLPVPTSSS